MQIVIDIDEESYEHIKAYSNEKVLPIGWYAIINGTPLPKGHGKIADLSAVYKDICNDLNDMTRIGVAVDGDWLWAKLNDAIDNAPTIIEAEEVQNADSN